MIIASYGQKGVKLFDIRQNSFRYGIAEEPFAIVANLPSLTSGAAADAVQVRLST